jgi:hypothetical protein
LNKKKAVNQDENTFTTTSLAIIGANQMRLVIQKFLLVLLLVGSSSSFAQATLDTVPFRITEISSKTIGDVHEKVWLASHETQGGAAQFRISLQLKQPSGNSPFSFSKGAIEHVKGSSPQAFIKRLSAALMAKGQIAPKSRVEKLPFDVAILGLGLSRANGSGQFSGGAFAAKPTGPWIATKIFLAGGEGEVFLNLDPTNGVGEFSIKDEGYGNVVIQELSRVL